VPALRGILPTLKRIAAHSRFGGDHPVIVGVGPGSVSFRAVNGDVDARFLRGPATLRQAMVPWNLLSAAVEDPATEVIFSYVNAAVSIGDYSVPTNVEPVGVPDSAPSLGQALLVPRFTGSSTYLMQAMGEPTRPPLQYALLELPTFTLVTSDAHRIHVQYAPENLDRERAPVEVTLLLTKDQLVLLWEEELAEKALIRTEVGCRVAGTQHGFQVMMDFRTGVGQFPEWRPFLTRQQMSYLMAVADLLREAATQPRVRLAAGTILEREYVRDALTGWEGDTVVVGAVDAHSPAIFTSDHREAVIMYAVEVSKPAGVAVATTEREVRKVTRRRAQTAAPGAAGPSVGHYTIGQEVATPAGTVKILKDRVSYLVQLPTGRKRWFSDPGLTRFLAGQPGTEEAPGEPAA
jgi:hypothetical protein